ncbi:MULTISPECIES: glycoside hydrolase 43 family protein [unclassified Paenibacillus]|uniref:glycoside hydrolase family 43 protein n=1 Tax=unclassified Paenibacillus TaxID=185978 RepID=UPI00240662DF|nr:MULTISPECIES: glycoside hydrolase 43 family protein [unclassified Paenibacillus]MDF9842573.1 beta-xylosidase [Paenibacillus sp. PastF-2]MDF9849220.1 beta-xylosidase [Paenibacillus sp. PastM-2]MDF9855733.1 beta-xylosidase [Paenibacillus sp. PastF-1]MDH6481062.1 beta-xylosidase [Paenibacillus sp. PastH-2]MDH6508426.1 beta-xylosidase [Paenibacillus sp. PastM-3]
MDTATISNPVLWADVPDVDVIRVGPFFYMVSTSMHSMPGCPIMKSVNLRDWEIVNYVYDTFEDNDAHRLLDGKGIYGKGSWAASLKYKDGLFYVCFSSNDMDQFYIYRTDDIERGTWERSVIPGLHHDPALLLDDDGRNYVIYGNGDIRIKELTGDLTAVEPGGADQLLLEGERTDMGLRIEGCHAYKLNGYYYLFFIEWPTTGNKRRRQVCYRSRELLGPYEHRIILDDDLGYHNNGVAQGGIVDTPDNDWYAVLFQDHDAVGRIPCVLPVRWDKDWPVIGDDGTAPQRFETRLPAAEAKPLVISDEFDYGTNKLALNWQWNHNPDNALWSVTERPGYLRLRTGQPADSILTARNTLTQRTEGPACRAETVVEISGMQPGDRAGMAALQNQFGTVRIAAGEHGQFTVDMCVNGGDGREERVERVSFTGERIFLRIDFNFRNSLDEAAFFYSEDGIAWNPIGRTLHMKYTLDHFMGYRIGLFHYATRQAGGYADFDYFHYIRQQ